MDKVLYVTTWDFEDENTNGICKKMLSQIKVIEQSGFDVDLCCMKGDTAIVRTSKGEKGLGKCKTAIKVYQGCDVFSKYIKNHSYRACYVRHCPASPNYIHMLKILRSSCEKVVVEVPTFPYDKELTGNWKLKLGAILDKTYRNKMNKYVDRIITYSNDDSIFGIRTIRTINGVDFDTNRMKEKFEESDSINLIGVAMLAPWHGFDRMIDGIGAYYQKNPERKVHFHIVGSGSELEKYKAMVKEYGIQEYVTFYGNQSGDALNQIYNKADIAVNSLAFHRIGLANASALKSREYGAKGLPMITEGELDFYPKDWKYYIEVPADESAVDINMVIKFYDEAFADHTKEEVAHIIRNETQKTADMKVTLAPVCEFISSEG